MTISHYKSEARVCEGKDGYHVTWYADGVRVKRQFKERKDAEEFAKDTTKLIHQGAPSLAKLSRPQMREVQAALERLDSTGISLSAAISEFLDAKRVLPNASLVDAAKAYVARHDNIKAMPFSKAAESYLENGRKRWATETYETHERRVRRLTAAIPFKTVIDSSYRFLTSE